MEYVDKEEHATDGAEKLKEMKNNVRKMLNGLVPVVRYDDAIRSVASDSRRYYGLHLATLFALVLFLLSRVYNSKLCRHIDAICAIHRVIVPTQ